MPSKIANRSRRPFISEDAVVACFGLGIVAAWLGFLLACAAAWVTHVVVCIKTASWILLLFGAVVAPIGVIHGWGIWFGVF